MAGENLRKIQPGSGNSKVYSFLSECLSSIQCLWGQIALPKASSRCQQSLEVVSGFRERIRPLRASGSAESHELFIACGRERHSVVGLTSLSLKWCIILLCLRNFNYETSVV